MDKICLTYALLLLIINSFTLCMCATILNSTTDKQALLSFKNSIISDPNAILRTNWSGNSSFCDWIGVKCGLKHQRVTALNLSGYDLAGTVAPHLGNLTFLRSLDISSNNFSGFLPSELSKLRRLKVMRVRVNSLTGELPKWLGSLSQLEVLEVSYNNLSGSIPREIGNMTMLLRLALAFSNLTGEIPQEIGSLQSLEGFGVFGNSLSGSIPSSIFNISTLKILELSFNEFSGILPSDFGYSLFNLEQLLMGANHLSGPIPSSIINASKLTFLDMAENSFGGSIPNFGKLRLLEGLLIWGNNLSGPNSPTHELTFLSSLTNCRFLKTLEVSDNPLNGILPISIGNFSSSLKYIKATGNGITGVIPSEIGNLSSLLGLTLAGNQLSGPIPPTIGNMKKLQRIYLFGNQLVGSIPDDLCQLNNLGYMSLYTNMLVGPIPDCMSEVKSLRVIDLSSNQLNSTIPLSLWTLKDILALILFSNNFTGRLPSQLGNLKTINTLDLSSNKFSGDIPTSIDGCQSLEVLNLSRNQFGGPIPTSLGNVKGLVALDLSHNNLSGSIPKSLEDLHFLLNFSVSDNKLEGEIPNEGRFGNFTTQSFARNFALCGSPRLQVPPCSKHDGGSRENKAAQLMKYMVPSSILVAILVFVMLLFIRRRKQNKETLSPEISPAIGWRRISYIELERGTSSFSEANLLGGGSFGSVFRAILSDGLQVAVKVFNLQLEGGAKSFDTETKILGNIRHRNLVGIIGCCSNAEFKALILTYMPNGSLDKWLHSNMYSDMDLIQRLKIAIDVAAALEYLHHGYTFPVVHCDVKPSNVLLDEDMTARLSDFGISKLFEGGESFVQTQTLATIGYAAPELGTEGKVSTNGDVYSFGIMLLELFTGKKPTDDMFGGEMSLKDWVTEALQRNAATETLAYALLPKEDEDISAKERCVSSIFELAMKCLSVSPDERINMIQVVVALHKIINATVVAAIEKCPAQ